MSTVFNELLFKLSQGDCLAGSFIRRAVDDGKSILFDELFVRTHGGEEYITNNPQENEAFFNKVDYNGCGTNSFCSGQKGHNRYETIGNWRSVYK